MNNNESDDEIIRSQNTMNLMKKSHASYDGKTDGKQTIAPMDQKTIENLPSMLDISDEDQYTHQYDNKINNMEGGAKESEPNVV